GPGPRHNAGVPGPLRIIGSRDFVYRHAVGGVLAACSGAAPCSVRTKITAGGRTLATTGSELIGANEAAYLSFRLSPAGRSLLAGALGNQLPAHVTLTRNRATAQAGLVVPRFR